MLSLIQLARVFPGDLIEWREFHQNERVLFNPNTKPDQRRGVEDHLRNLTQTVPSGPYNITAAFNGIWIRPSQRPEYDNVDVVLIDARDNNLGLISKIRKDAKDVKMVATLSSPPYTWLNSIDEKNIFRDIFSLPDFVYMDSGINARLLESYINRDVQVLYNPYDQYALSERFKTKRQKVQECLGNNWPPRAFIFDDVGTSAVALAESELPYDFLICLTGRELTVLFEKFEYSFEKLIHTNTRYVEFIKLMEQENPMALIDCNFDSRFICECAFMGLPSIGFMTEHRKNLFPELIIEPFDTMLIKSLLTKLLYEDEFYEEVVEHAKEKAKELYSYEVAIEKFTSMVKEV